MDELLKDAKDEKIRYALLELQLEKREFNGRLVHVTMIKNFVQEKLEQLISGSDFKFVKRTKKTKLLISTLSSHEEYSKKNKKKKKKFPLLYWLEEEERRCARAATICCR